MGFMSSATVELCSLFPDAPVSCSIANGKTSNTLEKDLDLLASVPSPSSSVSRKVSHVGALELKNILKRIILIIWNQVILPCWNWTLVFLILDSSLNPVSSLLQPRFTIHSILSRAPKKVGPLSGLLLKMCYTVKADTLGQLPSMRVTPREFGGVRNLKLLMATIR